MSYLSFVAQHKELLTQLLDGRKELRQIMVTFLVDLGEAWEKMPENMPIQDRINQLSKITDKFMDEVGYGVAMLDNRFDQLFSEYNNTEKHDLKTTIKELRNALRKKDTDANDRSQSIEELRQARSEKDTKIEELNQTIDALRQIVRQKDEEIAGVRQTLKNTRIKTQHAIANQKIFIPKGVPLAAVEEILRHLPE